MKNKIIKENKKSFWASRPVSFFAHLSLFGLLAASFSPLARLFFKHLPPIGSDFYQTSVYFSYFNRFLNWPPLAWKYIWYNGVPAVFDYPWLHMYFGAALIHFFNSDVANEIYSLATLFLYLVFSYLLFYKLSKNKLFSAFLASLMIWSRSTYVALFGAGAGAFSANLMFAPLALFFLFKYFERGKKRWLCLAGVLSGLSVMGHQGMSILFVAIPSLLILIFYWGQERRFFSGQKLKDIFVYGLIFLFTGGLGLYPYLVSFLGSIFGFETNMGMQTSSWPRKTAILDLIGFTNIAFYLSLGLLILFVLIRRKLRRSMKQSLPFISLILYIFIFELLMYWGKNPFSETLGADRAYWFLPLAMGGLMALFFREIRAEKTEGKKISLGFVMKSSVIVVLAVGFLSAPNIYWLFKEHPGLARLMIPTENLLANPSPANETKVVPAWVDRQEKNYRLHASAAVTTWWNILFDLPVTTGYADPQGVKARSWAYWRDTSITSESVEHFKTPAEVAKNNAFFLTDWYAIKYIEYSNQAFSPPDYLFKNKDFFKQDQLMPETGYHFYEAQADYYSPIIRPTNAPIMLVISSQEGYNSFLRVLAQENLNSQYIIPVHYSEYIDDLTKINLSDFDGIFLYDYHYKNEKNFKSYPKEPWTRLLTYVKAGGKLFLETGAEVKESDVVNLPSSGLPEVFPVKTTKRGELGQDWQAEIKDISLIKDISVAKFDPLVYQGSAWKVSYADLPSVKTEAQIILTQKNEAVLVKENLGQGAVIWSGLNLPYHTKSYNNIEEGRFFHELLGSLVTLAPEKIPDFTFERNKSENIKIVSQNFKGILFKENNYGGWQAKIGGEAKGAYEAGLGMMYFPVKSDKKATVEITYRGLFIYWLMFILMGLTIFLVLVILIFGDRAISFFKKIFHVERIKNQTHSWWEKDEE